MALVGLLDAFRLLLIGPIFDRVLNPSAQSRAIPLQVPGLKNPVMLQSLVLPNMQNPWTVVAFALVTATVLKGICDFAGTYLVNYAGLGLLTDLRSFRIIHGYGTGQLKRGITSFLQQHPLVASISTAPPNQGGGGVTVVEMRD